MRLGTGISINSRNPQPRNLLVGTWADASTPASSAAGDGQNITLTVVDNTARLRQSFTTVPGQSYRLIIPTKASQIITNIGTIAGAVDITQIVAGTTSVNRVFVAASATTHFQFVVLLASGAGTYSASGIRVQHAG